MLKGYVFSEQLFENPIFALFINTFLDGKNGISNNFLEGMEVTFSGSNITINSGVACIQGRFVGEDTYTTISTGTDTAYCKLVIEINLDEVNTASDFKQASYKIIKSTSGYPSLTQTNIVKNNSGIYQYELARFKTSASGITDFQDKRTFLDFETIYQEMQEEYEAKLSELQDELDTLKSQYTYMLKTTDSLTATVTLKEKIIWQVNFPPGLNKQNSILLGAKFKKDPSSEFVDIAEVSGVTYEIKDDFIEIEIDGRSFGIGEYTMSTKIAFVQV